MKMLQFHRAEVIQAIWNHYLQILCLHELIMSWFNFNIYVYRKLGVINSCSVGYLPIFCRNGRLTPLFGSDLSMMKGISASKLRNNCKDDTSDILI